MRLLNNEIVRIFFVRLIYVSLVLVVKQCSQHLSQAECDLCVFARFFACKALQTVLTVVIVYCAELPSLITIPH